MAWHYIRGSWWIIAIPVTVSVLVGTGVSVFDIVAEPSPQMEPDFLNPFTALGVFFLLSPFVALFLIFRMGNRSQKREALLVENGIRGFATIISLRETGLTTNNVPQLEMQLEVSTIHTGRYTGIISVLFT